MSYAILRTVKLKTFGEISSVSGHHYRTRETLNADPARTEFNIQLVNPGQDLVSAVKARIGHQKIRKNGVLAVEVLMTASPEFFRQDPNAYGTYDAPKVNDLNVAAITFLKSEFGDENLISAICHLDEATPHVQAVIVPIDPRGKLNASHWFDGKKKLSEMQDRFYSYTESLGLTRGLKGSEARHTTLKTYYGSLNAQEPIKIPRPDVAIPPITLMLESSRKDWAKSESERIELYQKPSLAPVQAQAALTAIATKKKVEAERTLKKYVDQFEALRNQANLVIDIDLVDVIGRWGGIRDPYDKKKHLINGSHISINGSQFFDHDIEKTGSGAIDLLMHLEGCDFRHAVARLASEYGQSAAVGAAMVYAKNKATQASEKPINLPEAFDQHWASVRKFLITVRRLDEKHVDWLYERKMIFSDYRQNACFRYGDKGVEKIGTRGIKWNGFVGKKDHGFLLKRKNPEGAFFVESAIDAISFFKLIERPIFNQYKNYDVISLCGVNPNMVLAMKKNGNYQKIAIGFNDNEVANNSAKIITDIAKDAAERVKPGEGCNDWNDYIRSVNAIMSDKDLNQPENQNQDEYQGLSL